MRQLLTVEGSRREYLRASREVAADLALRGSVSEATERHFRSALWDYMDACARLPGAHRTHQDRMMGRLARIAEGFEVEPPARSLRLV